MKRGTVTILNLFALFFLLLIASSGAVYATTKQTIVIVSFNPIILTVGETTTVSATATSWLPVTFTSTTPSVCTVSGDTITDLTAGVCTVAANQAGDTTYSPAPQKTKSITVQKKKQTIGAISLTPTVLAVDGNITVSATATSGLPVSFSSTTPSTCAVLGSTVRAVTTGYLHCGSQSAR